MYKPKVEHAIVNNEINKKLSRTNENNKPKINSKPKNEISKYLNEFTKNAAKLHLFCIIEYFTILLVSLLLYLKASEDVLNNTK